MNKTRCAISIREGVEHVLNFLATEDFSELDKARSAFDDATAQAVTRAEKRYVSAQRRATKIEGYFA